MNRLKNRESRSLARHHRQITATILEMHAKTRRAKQWDMEFEAWTKTAEYQEERRRIQELIAQAME